MGKYDHLIGTELASGEFDWDPDRAMLYAVGVGAGLQDPLEELQFTTENSPGSAQQVLPTFLVQMGIHYDWAAPFGFAQEGPYPVGVVHGEQSFTLARPIPTRGRVRLSKRLRGVYDKGSGALIVFETQVTLDGGEPLGSSVMSLFAQGMGGFGGPRSPADAPAWARPERQPDAIVSLPVGLNQSLIFRLLGDHNLHGTDPAKAQADGFPRPVFYGLGSYGVAGRAVLRALCDGDAARFGSFHCRFSKPVHPGDRLDTHIWRTEGGAVFQTLANGERVALDHGVFRFADAIVQTARADAAIEA